MTEIPKWHIKGDWFDVCSCDIPCPCTFAQPPDAGHCEGALVYHIRDGRFGDLALDGLNVVALAFFDGNLWTGEAHPTMGMLVDERADDHQREAIQTIFGGQAGGWPAEFSKNLGEFRGVEFVPIEVKVADDLSTWSVSSPGKIDAAAEALSGPTSLPGKRTQTTNPPGAEMGPGSLTTWGRVIKGDADGFGIKFSHPGKSSKHMPVDWSGPDT